MHPLCFHIWRAQNAKRKGELLNRAHKMQGRRAYCTHCQLSVVQFKWKGSPKKSRLLYGLVRDAKKWLKNYLMLFISFLITPFLQICDNTLVTLGLSFLKTYLLFQCFSEKVWNLFNDLLLLMEQWRVGEGVAVSRIIKNNNVCETKRRRICDRNVCRWALINYKMYNMCVFKK